MPSGHCNHEARARARSCGRWDGRSRGYRRTRRTRLTGAARGSAAHAAATAGGPHSGASSPRGMTHHTTCTHVGHSARMDGGSAACSAAQRCLVDEVAVERADRLAHVVEWARRRHEHLRRVRSGAPPNGLSGRRTPRLIARQRTAGVQHATSNVWGTAWRTTCT